MTDPKYGLQLMSDGYILEEIINELRETAQRIIENVLGQPILQVVET